MADAARHALLGSGFDPATQIGPLVSQRQQEDVLRFIDTGRKEGAQLMAGGTVADRDGYFVQPTVFANTTGHALTLTREEVFGPVFDCSAI